MILTKNIYKNFLSPQKKKISNDKTAIARKKSINFVIKTNKIKAESVKKKGFSNFFCTFQGFFKDKKYTVIVRKIIRINKILGNVAGWMPLFNIGGTSSNVKVVKKANIENIKITKQALNSVVKKRDEFNFAPLFFSSCFIYRLCTL